MAMYIIKGGKSLSGAVTISGNKNATFPCIAAALLTDQQVILKNIPSIRDVEVMVDILKGLGVDISFHDHTLTIEARTITSSVLDQQLTTRLRGSILLAGALLSRKGTVSFFHPGGDVIGKRAINLHLEGFEKLGYTINQRDLFYEVVQSEKIESEVRIYFMIPTVTGTENLILASVLRNGVTILKNCAMEPHVVDLCNLLNQMGGNIEGVGTPTLVITGVEKLFGTSFRIGSDNIEFGTYAVAAGLTGGEITIKNTAGMDNDPIIAPLEKMGLHFAYGDDEIKVSSEKLKALPSLITAVWPGFPTDLMSVIIVLATQAEGVSLMHDWLYESRMFFTDKLISMGAHITIADPHRVLVSGPAKLVGRNLETPDIRAGMAMVLAALIAEGESTINRAELIERGYDNVVNNFNSLGAAISRHDS
jgi:UDP-N-acetylglucosamine 1-carboxyvinyltransferase